MEQGGKCVDIRRANLTDNTVFPLNTVDLGNKIGNSTLCKGIMPKACCECYERGETGNKGGKGELSVTGNRGDI